MPIRLTFAAIAMLAATPAPAASLCDRFLSKVMIVEIEGRKCAYAFARCREGVEGEDRRFTGEVKSNAVGRGRLACRPERAKSARSCLADESEHAQFCWARRDAAFRPGGLE